MLLKNKKIYIITLGCRVNLFESNWIESKLISNGAIKVSSLSQADICIINTCSVTNKADTKTKNFLRRILKCQNLKLTIAMGCFSQVNKEYFLNNKFDIVIGNKYKTKIVELILDFKGKQTIKIDDLSLEKSFEYFSCKQLFNSTRAHLKIQDGCNYKCNYCIIPQTRGKQRSLPREKIFQIIKNFTSLGTKEIVLTGVNTAGYGENSTYKFENLLEEINNLPGDFRVRISSLEPFQISDKIIDIITTNKDRWCQHFHICLQSSSNTILRSMNRKYSFTKFENLFNFIYSKNNLISITTDYIVGFPTETNELFEEGYKNLHRLPFADIHIFPYSDRKGTLSCKLEKKYSQLEKTNRLKKITSLKITHQKKYLKNFKGKVVNVLFEKSVTPGIQHGHSEYFFQVYVSTNINLQNQLLPVLVEQIIDDKIYGSLLKNYSDKVK